MSKHHIKSLAEQMAQKGHGSSPFHYGKPPYQVIESNDAEDLQKDSVIDNRSMQLRAYHLYQEKGGDELDNWLEAEQNLKNESQASSRFINEGNPNLQR
jgi:hypothetical protein